ncbi:biotin carboxylase N-terminal domain-containing protein [Microbacterium telephonicum]|uniref:biotin carboxylase n=1 Tax=Microbacterium telephonicum TaxID=1714841 RepID=A0A498C3K7_9MICO|nr:biotin carboxylase N-terminal domain-containing protein [Microbacterium telephonicum]RLK49557.1 acetyl/propionyl-CoA carboxylase alpha subunit [Microbacterium telephonicum]
MTASLHTVLVANRGEIARRVIRTVHRMGLRAVAVYSDADADAPHVREADAAVRLGPASAARSYLDADAVLRAARESGADAVHPGYGFLSENAAFARACAAAGIVFVGPGEEALAVMGDKIHAKAHVAAHGVPTVPGFSAAGMDDDEIAAAASRTGFPLLVKPSAGGGGKGMQVVRRADELPAALATARRIARAAFGDDTLLLERLLERPRHIEVQVLADAHGTTLHLGERECTLQRRHQKVIEEAPSPIVDAALRERLGAAACRAAASVGYVGAGTVEFLVAAARPDEFFFIEMNTRLQVEHPVTELVTGVDLVEQQLRIAAGEPLRIRQDDVRLSGHAVEARVYAESPATGFLPATGTVRVWRAAPGVRTDAAVESGSVVTADYDPMIAKVIAHAPEREAALAALDRALADTVVLGVETNIPFLRTLVQDDDVVRGDLDTGLIERMPAPTVDAPTPTQLRLAAAALRAGGAPGGAAGGVWPALAGRRFGRRDAVVAVHLEGADGHVHLVTSDDAPDPTPASPDSDADTEAAAVVEDGVVWVHADGATASFVPLTRRAAWECAHAARGRDAGAAAPELPAPMPGAVIAVHVADGDDVVAGERILTIEAMKMEHAVTAPHPGTVRLRVAAGAQVRRGDVVAVVDPTPTAPETREPTASGGTA